MDLGDNETHSNLLQTGPAIIPKIKDLYFET